MGSPAQTTPLFPCPDCTKEISRRAVSCPHCGCPGSAIADAVAQAEAKERPKRLASALADQRRTRALLAREDDHHYVLLDVATLIGTSSLAFTELGTDKPIAYSDPELAKDAPLIRFKVSAETRAEFRPIAPIEVKPPPAYVLTETDEQLPGAGALDRSDVFAACADNGALVAMRLGGDWVPLHRGMAWIGVKPADLRLQLDLIARARQALESGSLPARDAERLRATSWLTPHLKELALSLAEKAKHATP